METHSPMIEPATHPLNDPAIAQAIEQACTLIQNADALLITAGAGMGVDSGLPDFRGKEGFWQAYPALRQRKLSFIDIATPSTFARDPRLAWGFYGHRLQRYRNITPHPGFTLLRTIGERLPHGYFVFTSNVDGQFQRAGYAQDRIVECHGSIHHLQCTAHCTPIWSANDFHPEIDERNCNLTSDLPTCPGCGAIARPNIHMFNDWHWRQERTAQQETRLGDWLNHIAHPVIIEIGAGHAVPTVRYFSERLAAPLIRINPTDYATAQGIEIPLRGLEAIQAISAALLQRNHHLHHA